MKRSHAKPTTLIYKKKNIKLHRLQSNHDLQSDQRESSMCWYPQKKRTPRWTGSRLGIRRESESRFQEKKREIHGLWSYWSVGLWTSVFFFVLVYVFFLLKQFFFRGRRIHFFRFTDLVIIIIIVKLRAFRLTMHCICLVVVCSYSFFFFFCVVVMSCKQSKQSVRNKEANPKHLYFGPLIHKQTRNLVDDGDFQVLVDFILFFAAFQIINIFFTEMKKLREFFLSVNTCWLCDHSMMGIQCDSIGWNE